MIAFLTLIYVGILMLAIKTNVIRPTMFWKISPVFVLVLLTIGLLIPLQFWAPSGPMLVGNYTVPIVPQVGGVVTELHAAPNQPLKKGDVLFELDKTLFEADIRDLEARLTLARTQLSSAQRLAESQAGAQIDVDRFAAQVAQIEASLEKARYSLAEATVRAPGDGYVTNVVLREGSRVVSAPLQPAMTFIETGEPIVATQIAQNYLRNIEPGQRAEIAFKMYPGRIYSAEVLGIVPARATGFESMTGLPVVPQGIVHAPFAVRLKLGEEANALELPSGVTGQVAIYTETGKFAHIIRMFELRLEAIVNYFNPF